MKTKRTERGDAFGDSRGHLGAVLCQQMVLFVFSVLLLGCGDENIDVFAPSRNPGSGDFVFFVESHSQIPKTFVLQYQDQAGLTFKQLTETVTGKVWLFYRADRKIHSHPFYIKTLLADGDSISVSVGYYVGDTHVISNRNRDVVRVGVPARTEIREIE